MTVHQLTHSREYKAWRRMRSACENPNTSTYPKHGGRGISICSEWKKDFLKFLGDMGDIPAMCNGLALIDDTKDFCKANCEWVKKNVGRPRLPKTAKKNKVRSKILNPQTICLVMEKEVLDFIKNQALQISMQKGSYVEPNDLIREALCKAFPAPKQFDMFGDRL